MSIQAGVWQFDGKPVDRSLLECFSQQLARFGPDGEHILVEGSVGMLYRPFHTTKESRQERQPHVSISGNMVTWDGRLDNRDELATLLGTNSAASTTDLALVSAAFDRWGTDAFSKLVGDWAVTIWTPSTKTLTMAIDYMAIKHLFYYLKAEAVLWSSDLEALVLQPGDPFDLDDEYVAGYLAYNPAPGRTPYLQIRGVEPGHFVQIQDGQAVSRAYWKFNPHSRIRYKTDAEYEEHFRHVFRQAVRRRLRSDAPILADLSGGLDSSSIVCMADDIVAKESLESRIETISFYDLSEPSGDDFHYFTLIEKHRRSTGHHFDVSASTDLLIAPQKSFSAAPGSLGGDDEMNGAYARMWQTGRFRVALSGVGGDEMTGGVPAPYSQLADLLLRFRLLEFARQTTLWSLSKRKPWLQTALKSLSFFMPPYLEARFAKQAQVPDWIDGNFTKRFDLPRRQLGAVSSSGFWLPTRRESARTVCHMAELMASRVEKGSDVEERRYPYLDRCLVEFLLAVPAEQVLRPGERRSLMRRALAGIVPDPVLHRSTKAVTVRKPMVDMERNWEWLGPIVGDSFLARSGFLNQSNFHKAMLAAKNGSAPHLVLLLRTLSLEFWLRNVAQHGLVRGLDKIGDPGEMTYANQMMTTKSIAVPPT